MSWQKITVEFTGTMPTLMHNGQLCDPMNRWSKAIKEITSKRKKTDADHEEIARLEFLGSFYLDEDKKPCWPAENILRCIQAGAKKQRKGKDCEAGVLIDGDARLIYKGPTDPNELWENEQFRNFSQVRVQNNKVIRCRPMFPEWKIQFDLNYLPQVCNPSDIETWCHDAGLFIGLSDWRPRFGRFEVTKFKPEKGTTKTRSAA